MNNEGNEKEVGILVRNLAADAKEIHDLITKGNEIAGSLRLIADWLESLNNPDETRELTFDRHSRKPEATFRVSNAQGTREFPQDLLGHMKKVLELQEKVKSNREQLKEMLGIDTYAKYVVSIYDPLNE